MLLIYIYGRFILYWTMSGICCRYSSTRYTNQDVDRLGVVHGILLWNTSGE